MRLQVIPTPVRTSAFRSLAAAQNVFAIESFIDELAHASGQDPVAFRLRHIEDLRLKRVLETAAQRSAWTNRIREGGRGFGVACTIYHGTYVAEVVEVSVGSSGLVRVEQIWCAVNAGRLVNPDGARNQIEGGVQQAASWTLLEKLQHEGGKVTTTSFQDYPIATAHDAHMQSTCFLPVNRPYFPRVWANRARYPRRPLSPTPCSMPAVHGSGDSP